MKGAGNRFGLIVDFEAIAGDPPGHSRQPGKLLCREAEAPIVAAFMDHGVKRVQSGRRFDMKPAPRHSRYCDRHDLRGPADPMGEECAGQKQRLLLGRFRQAPMALEMRPSGQLVGSHTRRGIEAVADDAAGAVIVDRNAIVSQELQPAMQSVKRGGRFTP